MNPGETIRHACGDCQLVFDICLGRASEPPTFRTRLADDVEPTVLPLLRSGRIEDAGQPRFGIRRHDEDENKEKKDGGVKAPLLWFDNR